jgi:hypothetical protein
MNVAGVAAEAGGEATAVSECGIRFPVADVTGQRESLGERVVISGLPRRDDVPIRLERNREGVCGCLWKSRDGATARSECRVDASIRVEANQTEASGVSGCGHFAGVGSCDQDLAVRSQRDGVGAKSLQWR